MGSNINNDYLKESEEIRESGENDIVDIIGGHIGDNIGHNLVDNTVIKSEQVTSLNQYLKNQNIL